MTLTPQTDPSVEVRLERIQAAVDVGNAETRGKLDLLMQRLDHSEKLADERERRAAAELKERDVRMDRFEDRQNAQVRKTAFLAGSISTLGMAASLGVQLLHH